MQIFGPASTDRPQGVLSVSELTQKINSILEENFSFIWIKGEISNLRIPVSGHCYFTLKDAKAQISAVVFRGHARNLKFSLKDGMDVTGLGRLSVYAPRGVYQIIFEYLEPSGAGALQAAFEQLKLRLADEGLFDERHKQKLPSVPRRLTLITSPTGSVVHDLIRVAHRRFPNLAIQIIPVKVQGQDAPDEIAAAIDLLNRQNLADVAVLARGGGSLEDLQAFNSEIVARAVFHSRIPIVSAVGHETDYTIADFVADVRAPTPSAAAELAVPVKDELQRRAADLTGGLQNTFFRYLDDRRRLLEHTTRRMLDPKRRLQALRLRLDELMERMERRGAEDLRHRRERLAWRSERLQAVSPHLRLVECGRRLSLLNDRLAVVLKNHLKRKTLHWHGIDTHLQALNPNAVLARGYSITRTLPQGVVVRNPGDLKMDQRLEITVAKGRFTVTVDSPKDSLP